MKSSFDVCTVGMPIAFYRDVYWRVTNGPESGQNLRWNVMGYYRALDREDSAGPLSNNMMMGQYAWLEHKEGIWHFLTDLFAGPEESTRRWSNRQHAINELTREGWTIVGSYPESPSAPRPDCGGSCGYGLMRIGH